MYECGHRDGMLVQLYPGKIIELGFVIKKVFKNDLTFEIYSRVGDWRNYYSDGLDEELRILPQEAELWLMEASELEQAFSEQGNLPYRQVQQLISVLYEREAKSLNNLKQRLKSIAGEGSARIMPLLENLDDKLVSPESVVKEHLASITDTTKLCRAAIDLGNSIELLW